MDLVDTLTQTHESSHGPGCTCGEVVFIEHVRTLFDTLTELNDQIIEMQQSIFLLTRSLREQEDAYDTLAASNRRLLNEIGELREMF